MNTDNGVVPPNPVAVILPLLAPQVALLLIAVTVAPLLLYSQIYY
jgi:hypothetical protein